MGARFSHARAAKIGVGTRILESNRMPGIRAVTPDQTLRGTPDDRIEFDCIRAAHR